MADLSPGAASAPVHLIDISLSGAGFLHAGLLPSGRQFVLQVLLPDQSIPANFLVTIVYCQPRPASHFYRCGARITGAASGGALEVLFDFLTTPSGGTPG